MYSFKIDQINLMSLYDCVRGAAHKAQAPLALVQSTVQSTMKPLPPIYFIYSKNMISIQQRD